MNGDRRPSDPGDDELLEPAREEALVRALRSAYAPTPLASERHAEILALALEDPLAPPSEEEIRESERLRRALEDDDPAHPAAALARALRAATAPAPLDAAAGERAAEHLTRRKPNVVYVTFGALALAAAAAFALFAVRPTKDAVTSPERLLASRSTQELFHEPFATGKASERIDRIASARERDARENRYALWGVR